MTLGYAFRRTLCIARHLTTHSTGRTISWPFIENLGCSGGLCAPVNSGVSSTNMNVDPTTIYGSVFWGVVAGILTSALLFGLGVITSKIILPWYQDLVYQGVDLRGLWVNEFDYNGARYRFHTSLEQHAHRLTGITTITKSGTGQGDYVSNFDVTGSTWEGFVVLNLKSKDRKTLALATALFKVADRGTTLVGHFVFRSLSSEEVQSEKVRWRRTT